MKTFTDSTMMPFGQYGPDKGDPRALKDVPLRYLEYLSQRDWMYEHRELGEYIDARLNREADKIVQKESGKAAAPPPPAPRAKPAPLPKDYLKKFAESL